ncbi:MAG: DEAD/DEAH box helicase, partial [Myxococcota bacterium]|nr:DEAD/DEAH box helicase [Myxococcota bacterium]
MQSPTLSSTLGPELSSALERKGYTTLTSIQTAVLDPALDGRDLRITSQTGSGKTVAVGFALRDLVADKAELAPKDGGKGVALARPKALVVTPTRELAKQVEEELSWLLAPLDAGVISVTGGASYRDERRALSGRPAVVVGTPGRLLEHLRGGAVDATGVGAVVLDEADRLLDLGFREDLDAILAFAPDGHRTHLVSATFPREVRALADAAQSDPVHVEGTRLGAANVDIDHVVHLIDPRQRVDAIINLLLANPEEQTLVFARTRADVASIARDLKDNGFAATSLSGEMDQTARNRALAAFKRGDLRVLVATDVAARGIDVQDIARVIHAEPPTDADSYTHRSGRTGRAGRKGTSSILAVVPELPRTSYLLQRAGVAHRFEPIPTASTIRAAADERVAAQLTNDDEGEATGFDDRIWALAKRIAATSDVTRAIARLLIKTRYAGPTEPRDVRAVEPPSGRGKPAFGRGATGVRE